MAKQATQSAPANRVSSQATSQAPVAPEKANGQVEEKRRGRKTPEGHLTSKQKAALVAFPAADESLTSVPQWDYRVNKPIKKKSFAKDKRSALIREFYAKYRDGLIKQGSKIPYVQPGDDKLTEWPSDFDSAIHQPLKEDDFVSPLDFIDGKISSLQREISDLEIERKIKTALADKPKVGNLVEKALKMTPEERKALKEMLAQFANDDE